MGLSGWIERCLEWYLVPRRLRRQAQSEEGQRNWSELMLQAYRGGQYQNALAIGNAAARANLDVGAFRGEMLMQLGNLEEAAQALTQAASLEKDPKLAALANCMLGQALLFQQHHHQALDCFMTALDLWPERGATHRDIAEVWLRRDNPTEGLRWARLGVEKERASEGITPQTKATNLAVNLATLAWAVGAVSHDAAQVDQLAAEAMSLLEGSPATSIAQARVHLGMAYAALGDAARSTEHFEAGAAVDPNGIWGREAQRFGAGVLN